MAPKSIWRQPGAQHFQLVHRSQRDPLIHDPEASTHVLKGFERENLARKGKTRAELEQSLPYAKSERANIGEAAEYGVYFDDTNYDYMQHLRPVGMAADAILLEAPKGKGKNKETITLPGESLPSQRELSLAAARDAMQSVPSELAGFNPNLDQHLRQTLEALDDDAFVGNNDRLGEEEMEDLFGELLGARERSVGEQGEWDEWEFREEGIEPHTAVNKPNQPEDTSDDLVSRVAAFKRAQAQSLDQSPGEDEPEYSEGGDTIGKLPSLPPMSVIGGKRRRKGADSDASGFSMSSSSMFRNKGLRGLDAQFDRMEILYNSDEDIQDSDGDHEASLSKDLTEDDSDEAPELLDTREDLEGMMDEFLEKYEFVGNKMRPALGGITPAEKLATLRHALVDDVEGDGGMLQKTISRPRNESKEDKKARKEAVRNQKQIRRAEKSAMKEAFASERKAQQSKTVKDAPGGNIRKL
ncbi:hypothetical protein FRC11_015005 [Ceratobasidium sp. 423]|nr:hypothetical protein FRC11_015005 [Ceratobasidium sp. 423]